VRPAAVAALLGLAALAALSGRASAEQCIPLADFGKDAPGSFPKDWRPLREDAREVYRVMAEGGGRFLRGLSRGVGTQALLDRPWDLREHPVLAWKWRPRVFPEGSDERRGGANDSALGVYVGFPQSRFTVKALKYVWSRVAPEGTETSASAGMTKMRILRQGPAKKDAWTAERVNVIEDYRRLFGSDPDKPLRGIGVLTDSDDTKSTAEGDYADFRVCRP
jgi:hypothetical protein